MTTYTKTTKASPDFSDSVMICFYIPEDLPLAIEGGLTQEDLHCTLLYLGKTSDIKDVNYLISSLANFAMWQKPMECSIDGVVRFCQKEPNPFCLVVSSPQLCDFRQSLCNCLTHCGISSEGLFNPHVTLSYLPSEQSNPFEIFKPVNVTFPFLYLQLGQDTYKFPLGKGDLTPPNYHQSEGTIQCDYCLFSSGGYCNLYNFQYDTGYVCDDFQTNPPMMSLSPDMIKAGRRHSEKDNSLLRDIFNNAETIKQSAIALGHEETEEETEEEDKSVDIEVIENATEEYEDELENNALKALREDEENLVVGNYITLFHSRDLEGVVNGRKNKDGSKGEYFTPETEFESEYTKSMGMLAVDWEHGFDNDPESPQKDDILGYVDWATAKIDAKGVWVERVLNRRNKYIKMLESLIKDGLIGNSSEAVSSGVVKGSDGRIIKWPLKRDTLTVMPMEPRMLNENHLIALKALGIELEILDFKKKQLQIQLELQKEFV